MGGIVMGFLSEKRWEMVLAAAMPVLIPLADAYEQGAFHGKSIVTGIIFGAIIALRALASQKQSPPSQPPTP